MKEALLYRKLEGGRVRCAVCALRCVIPEGGRGSCRTRVNRGGTLYTLLYGRTSSVAVDPVEKKPLYHVHPGSRVLSMGARGCNFRCPGCQNGEISRDALLDDGESMEPLAPRESVELALRHGSGGICWTYNEPAIWLEHALEAMVEARRSGLYTAYVTNGYATPEHLDLVGPHLTAWRVDLKGFSREVYKRISGISRWEPVLEATRLAARKFGIHVECVTNVTPGINDDEKTARGIAAWIRQNLGPFTPWHVTRFHPHGELSALPPTPIRTLERFCDIAGEEGLQYVYIGNVPGHPREDTLCHACGKAVIRRKGYAVDLAGFRKGACAACGAAIPGRF